MKLTLKQIFFKISYIAELCNEPKLICLLVQGHVGDSLGHQLELVARAHFMSSCEMSLCQK